MIHILQRGLERSVCLIYTLYETSSPIYNQDKPVLINNETIAGLEELGYIVLTKELGYTVLS